MYILIFFVDKVYKIKIFIVNVDVNSDILVVYELYVNLLYKMLCFCYIIKMIYIIIIFFLI